MNIKEIKNDEYFDFNEFYKKINKVSKETENSINHKFRRETGSYFTSLDLCDEMTDELVNNILMCKKPIYDNKFFEPCVGTGNFVFSYLRQISKLGLNKSEIETLINNMYFSDINENFIKVFKNLFAELLFEKWNINIDEDYFKKHISKQLVFNEVDNNPRYISLNEAFHGDIDDNFFDIVITNPPYKNLKAEKNNYSIENEYLQSKARYKKLAEIVRTRFKYSGRGVLNLYKIFVEEIIEKYTNKSAFISILVPTTILSDANTTDLRRHILFDHCLISVKNIQEDAKKTEATQALSALLIKKDLKTKEIAISNINGDKSDAFYLNIDRIENLPNISINATCNKNSIKNMEILNKYPKIKELDFIHNLRGELDLTFFKNFITNKKTKYKLVRGRNVSYYQLKKETINEYVSPEFLKKNKKSAFSKGKRIACQQISNLKNERRIQFCLIDKNYILGNSCNFISVDNNIYGVDIYAILGLLNSKIINNYFKLSSSNNHVNNYEIDEFPIPIESNELKKISCLVKEYNFTFNKELLVEIEDHVINAYGLLKENTNSIEDKLFQDFYLDIKNIIPNLDIKTALRIYEHNSFANLIDINLSKFEFKVLDGLIKKYQNLKNGYILNFEEFKLSDLDLEMIKNVPQGGNWKHIPPEIVKKSKRLERITKTGGRTTLYGRIDYQKPSYTITTYYNRPGNGTYVHPTQERVLTTREAARFQTFRDDYYFYGNKNQQLKQVGNAVPTIFAFQLAKKIIGVTKCNKSIDLFCGAGGMMSGFKAAGITSLVSNDIEESACITLKINNPEVNVICDDITKVATKKKIKEIANNGGAEIICGGPPCQGFSMAGFRNPKDPRNQLFRDFVDVVRTINPKIIVFENVEGLLSYQRGETYKEITDLFSSLGFNVEGRTIMMNEFAVPQKRKRVIIICTRKDLDIDPSKLFPEKITLEPEKQITARETIFDLDGIKCGDNAKYKESDLNSSAIKKFLKKEMTYDEYCTSIRNKK